MKLAHKSSLGTTLIVVASIAAILTAASDLISGNLESGIEGDLARQVSLDIAGMQARLDAIGADARDLAGGPVIARFLGAGGTGAGRTDLEARLAGLIANHPAYFQARFIDENGVEIARVDRAGGAIAVVDEAALQDKSGRDYVQAMLGLAAGDIYLSAIDLNREHGEIERPIRPALRVAAPVFDSDGVRRGGFVINVQAVSILPARARGAVEVRIVSAAGEYLLHPDPAWQFGRELGTGLGFEREFGRGLPEPGPEDARRADLDMRVPPGRSYVAAYRWFGPGHGAPEWLFVAAEPKEVALAPVRSAIHKLVAIAAVVAAFGCLAGWIKAQRITRQVSSVARIAKRIAGGSHHEVVHVTGSDEVAEMSAAFNTMTGRLSELLEREAESNRLLADTNAELKRSNADLENFARAAAHDLKSPLRAITALLDWIREDFDSLPAALDEQLTIIYGQVGRLQALTDGLLSYSVLGGPGSEVREIETKPVIESLLRTLPVPKGFRVDIRAEAARIRAVPTEFEIILRNLIENAIKHHDREAGRIEVTVSEVGDRLVIAVADDGPGVAPDEHAKILRPLYSGRGSANGGGSGLGLAFIAKIADRWFGRVDVVSAPPERGTTFRIDLPKAPEKSRFSGPSMTFAAE